MKKKIEKNKKQKSKKMNKKTILFVIGTIIALLAIIVLSLYLIKKPRYEKISFSYEVQINEKNDEVRDKYEVDAYLKNWKVEKTEVVITYYGKDDAERKKVAEYYYELMKEQDKYENLEIDGITLKYKSFDDQSKNKTKEEIERSYTKSKMYKNFKWEE